MKNFTVNLFVDAMSLGMKSFVTFRGWKVVSLVGQKAIYKCGTTGIPIINSNNNGATGGTALYMAYISIRSGM